MEKNYSGLSATMGNITSSFKALKGIVIFSISASLLTAVACVILFVTSMNSAKSKIYILDRGASFSASMQDVAVTRGDEVKDQIIRFHSLFFNVPPDMEMIKSNLEKALQYADKSAYNYYQDLQESGYYRRMVNASAYQQIQVEDIDINMETYPYTAVIRSSQWITRESNMTKFSLITKCVVVNTPRSPKNLHGLMIQDFQVVENRQLETRKR